MVEYTQVTKVIVLSCYSVSWLNLLTMVEREVGIKGFMEAMMEVKFVITKQVFEIKELMVTVK